MELGGVLTVMMVVLVVAVAQVTVTHLALAVKTVSGVTQLPGKGIKGEMALMALEETDQQVAVAVAVAQEPMVFLDKAVQVVAVFSTLDIFMLAVAGLPGLRAVRLGRGQMVEAMEDMNLLLVMLGLKIPGQAAELLTAMSQAKAAPVS